MEKNNPSPQSTTLERFVDLVQHARFLETARALKCIEDEAAFDEKLKAALGSDQSRDAQILDALNKGIQLDSMRIARSRDAIDDSKAAIKKADKVLK